MLLLLRDAKAARATLEALWSEVPGVPTQVVAHASGDAFRVVCREHSRRVHLVEAVGRTPGAILQELLDVCRSRLVVLLAEGARPTPGWLRELEAAVENGPALAGPMLPPTAAPAGPQRASVLEEPTPTRRALRSAATKQRFAEKRCVETEALSPACLAVPRKLLTRTGGFDARFEQLTSVVRDLRWRTRAVGAVERVACRALVWSPPVCDPTLADLSALERCAAWAEELETRSPLVAIELEHSDLDAVRVRRLVDGFLVDTHAYEAKPWWKLGTVLIGQGDYQSAMLATERAASYASEDRQIRERAAQLALALLDTEEPPTVLIPSSDPERVARCLEAMLALAGETYHEALVVCDGELAAFESLLARFPRLRLLPGKKPFVFSRNVNLGIASCCGDVVLLNDDAAPATLGWLDALATAAHSQANSGPVSPLLSECDHPPQDARRHDGRPEVREVGAVTFTCVYLTRSLIEQVGLLDEGLVWYGWEDNDYCHRALSVGRQPLVVTEALVLHDEPSATFGHARRVRRALQAHRYTLRKMSGIVPPCMLLIVFRDADLRTVHALEHLLAITPGEMTIRVVHEGAGNQKAVDRLLDVCDPRLTIRFEDAPVDDAELLDFIAQENAEVVVQVEPGLVLPEGWLAALMRTRPTETSELGVVALGRADRPQEGASESLVRVGGAELARVDAAGIAGAAAKLVTRKALDAYGPLAGAGPDSPWLQLAMHLERGRRVCGIVHPGPLAEPLGEEEGV